MPLNQKFALLARNPHGGMIIDDVAPAIVCDQPISRGEIDAGLPLGRRNFRLRDSGKLDVRVHEGASRAQARLARYRRAVHVVDYGARVMLFVFHSSLRRMGRFSRSRAMAALSSPPKMKIQAVK